MSTAANEPPCSSQQDRADWGRSDWANLADAYRNAYMHGVAPDIDEITREINAPSEDADHDGGAR